MSDRGDVPRLVKVMRYINDLKFIVSRHGGTDQALSDTEGKHAVMMCLLQIGELLNRLKDPELINLLDVPKVIAFRNLIAHEYDSLMVRQIEIIMNKNLPIMEQLILARLKKESDYPQLEVLWLKV